MQTTRRIFQGGFLLLTLAAVFVFHANAERWCPFGGVEAAKTFITEGSMTCSLGVSNFYALIGLLVSVILLRRAFCGYLCPIGTISEWIGRAGARLGLGPRRVPAAVDRVLSLLKYVVLAVILWFTWRADELLFRTADPCYALLSRHGEDITFWAYVVSGAIVVGSLFVMIPFCRWFCPLAAVMNPLSRFGIARVRRNEATCVNCGKCDDACPMQIPVQDRMEVTDARCTSCLSCVSACPVREGGALAWGPPRRLGPAWPQPVLATLLAVSMAAVVVAAYAFPIASFVRVRGEASVETATLDMQVDGVNCRGSSTLLYYFLTREDIFEVPGYLKLETWPAPDRARVRVTFDPALTDPDAICEAIVMPVFEELQNFERPSPFEIDGYSPWGTE